MKTETEDRLVVDASVIGAMFFQEPEAEFAQKRLSGAIWVAPALLDYEIASIFLKKLRRYPNLRKPLEACYQVYRDSVVERVEIPVAAAVPIAEKFRLTIYDASYFWLASEMRLELFTFDKALSNAWAASKTAS